MSFVLFKLYFNFIYNGVFVCLLHVKELNFAIVKFKYHFLCSVSFSYLVKESFPRSEDIPFFSHVGLELPDLHFRPLIHLEFLLVYGIK